jgi:molybdate transport system substrate-binding protein
VLVGGNGELSQLGDPALSLAIANPQTAPYGLAATEILSRPEFSSGQGRKLIRGNNVTQAYQFWHSGGTNLALVARSIAPDGTPIAADWHQPVEQHAVLLSRGTGKAAVQAYMNWIRSDRVRSNILEAGYDPCP